MKTLKIKDSLCNVWMEKEENGNIVMCCYDENKRKCKIVSINSEKEFELYSGSGFAMKK